MDGQLAASASTRLTGEQVLAELSWYRLVIQLELESAITEAAAALATTRAIQSE